jgi:hypothetical protein
MAVLALSWNVCEIEVGMAIATCHGGVLTAERKPGLCMVEPDLSWDDLPICCGVTRVARHIQPSVWTSCRGKRASGARSHDAHKQGERNHENEESIGDQCGVLSAYIGFPSFCQLVLE